MSLLPTTHDNALQKRRGIAKFAPRNANGTLQAAINLSPSAELTFSVAVETSDYISQESGNAEVLASDVDQINRTLGLTCNRMTAAIMAAFMSATLTDVTQASATVTGEISPYIFADRSFQLGGTTNNGAGIFGVTATTAIVYEGDTAPDWATAVTHAVGDVVVPVTPNLHWYMAVAITTGTTAASEPTFPTNGTTVVDGGVTWRDMGLIIIANVANADFEVDSTYGVVNVPSTGALATAVSRVPAVLRAAGRTFRLDIDYTRAARTVEQIATGGDASKEGEFWFYSQNPKGRNEVWRIPEATLTPGGDLSLKSGTEYAAVPFAITAKKPAVLEAIYINGVPAG